MALNYRYDSVAELSRQKTREQLAAENEELRAEITDLQLALCDVYEMLVGSEEDTPG